MLWKVVVLIGSAASAVDISREIAEVAKEVHISSRTDKLGTGGKLAGYDNIWLHSMVKLLMPCLSDMHQSIWQLVDAENWMCWQKLSVKPHTDRKCPGRWFSSFPRGEGSDCWYHTALHRVMSSNCIFCFKIFWYYNFFKAQDKGVAISLITFWRKFLISHSFLNEGTSIIFLFFKPMGLWLWMTTAWVHFTSTFSHQP